MTKKRELLAFDFPTLLCIEKYSDIGGDFFWLEFPLKGAKKQN